MVHATTEKFLAECENPQHCRHISRRAIGEMLEELSKMESQAANNRRLGRQAQLAESNGAVKGRFEEVCQNNESIGRRLAVVMKELTAIAESLIEQEHWAAETRKLIKAQSPAE